MPSVIIVDDEGGARRGMRRLLEAHSDVEILGEASSVSEAVGLLKSKVPDIVFLDVEMAGGNGFGLVDALDPATKVIFVTAHVIYAAKAFEVEAVDYLLKPVRPERLAKALERVSRESPPAPAKAVSETDSEMQDHITLRDNGRVVVVPLRKVAALIADGYCTRFLISGERSLMVGTPIGSHADRLPEEVFFRVGRSMIINLRRVESLEMASRDVAVLRLEGIEESIQLKRAAVARLRTAISHKRESGRFMS
jgi:two-component system LytT family response regulator